MISRFGLVIAAFLTGLVVAAFVPGLSSLMGKAVGVARQVSTTAAGHEIDKKPDTENGLLKLTSDQVAAAGIEVATVEKGVLVQLISVPGSIVPDADRIAHVAVRLTGTVAELRKRPGDNVAKDEVLAIFESRELADAKSEYLAARLSNELQQDLFKREKAMWDGRLSSEMQFLRARNEALRAQVRVDTARQKLLALGLGLREIETLPDQPEALMRQQEVRSPIAGRIVERKVDVGAALGRDNLETELFVVVDLTRVWVELAVSPTDLPTIKEGQIVLVASRSAAQKVEGKVIFVSPSLDKETRTARVVAEIDNADGRWPPGSFVSATIATDEQPVGLVVPAKAIQTVAGERVVFVRTPEGFRKRIVVSGRSDQRSVEIVSGLQAGDTIAVGNTFLLKSELMKGTEED